jgi:hypothetical protein
MAGAKGVKRRGTDGEKEVGAPPEDTLELYVEMRERDIYFLETIFKGYDGIAHVRRDWLMRGGRRFVKILVPPGLMDEVLRILRRVKRYIPIGEIRTEL